MEKFLEQMVQECAPYAQQGKLADYIPELAKANPNAIGVHIITCDGKQSWSGNHT
ncbi:MAG: glutaminase, partial [Oscillospiraceae bacterium]|nr:glutaminase [Oscillospiraceae bacterium]